MMKKKNPCAESQPDKDSFSRNREQSTHLAGSLLLIIQMSLIISALPTSGIVLGSDKNGKRLLLGQV